MRITGATYLIKPQRAPGKGDFSSKPTDHGLMRATGIGIGKFIQAAN
jgi:hypothetical protein